MANEDWENKKLAPILVEAYNLVIKIENRKMEADKEIKKLEAAKKKLADKHKQLEEWTTYDDQ